MRFAQSYYMYGFWIILALALFLIWARRRKKLLLRRFAEPLLLEEIASSVDYKKRTIKSAIIVLALVFGVLALMRPQWGFQWEEVKRTGLDIIIAIDTSKSMLATDVKPNRLLRSKLAVKDLVKKLKGDRIGLIAFSGTAFLQCPLTVDYGGFLLALDDLSVNTIPYGGTSISSAIEVALKSFETGYSKYKVLVIITDGEDHLGDPVRMAEKCAKEGIKIFCIGIGTEEGELIRLVNEKGEKVFLKDRAGTVVKTRLNEDILRKITVATGASYIRASGAELGLDYLYEEKLSGMEKKEIKAQMQKLYYERFQIPLAIALALFLIESLLGDRKKHEKNFYGSNN